MNFISSVTCGILSCVGAIWSAVQLEWTNYELNQCSRIRIRLTLDGQFVQGPIEARKLEETHLSPNSTSRPGLWVQCTVVEELLQNYFDSAAFSVKCISEWLGSGAHHWPHLSLRFRGNTYARYDSPTGGFYEYNANPYLQRQPGGGARNELRALGRRGGRWLSLRVDG